MERFERYGGFDEGREIEAYGFPYGSAYEAEMGGGRYAALRSRSATQELDHLHTWRGGVLGWLGSGMRAAAAWTGIQMQRWGSLLGGKLSGGAEQIGESVRGGGERVGSALEEKGVEGVAAASRSARALRPPRTYRRPDERILDDVYERIARSGADAEEVQIEVKDGVVMLSGNVPSRLDRRIIDELTGAVLGVREVHNHLKLARRIEAKGAAEGGVERRAPEQHDGQERSQPQP